MMRQLIAFVILGANFVAMAESPFTTTTSLYCRAKCVDTWFGYHDSWLKYVECDVKLPCSEKLYCVEMPQPWVLALLLTLPALLVCCCLCACVRCCSGRRRHYATSNA